jgi:hypothetical protein
LVDQNLYVLSTTSAHTREILQRANTLYLTLILSKSYDTGYTAVKMIYNSMLVLALMGTLPFVAASPKKHHKGGKHSETSSISSSQSSLMSAPPLHSYHTSQPHTSFTGTLSTTGALTASSIGTGISSGGVNPEATSYPEDGGLHRAEPAPYEPAGGVGTNGSTPVYNAKSDFDYESLVSDIPPPKHTC